MTNLSELKSTIVSIIIVLYNSEKYIVSCLESIIQFHYNFEYEIILIDNNSIKNIKHIIQNYKANITFIQNKSNIGFARACNQGIKISNGKYIFLLNPDTVILNNVFSIFYDFMEKKENELVWCVGAQLFDENGEPTKSVGKFPNIIDVISEQIGIKGILLKLLGKKYLRKRDLFEEKETIPFIIGCDMFIKRNALEKIGLFNEKFFLNYEETELSWRAKQYGLKSVILPEAKILHHSRKSFTNLQSYLNHLWLGQLLFFKLTKSHIIYLIAKVNHLFGASLRFVIKFDQDYLTHLKNILSI